MYCMHFFTAMSTVVPERKKADMETVRDGFLAQAVELTGGDQSQLTQAMKATADRAAASVVGTTPDERFAVSQRCVPYLKTGGVDKALAERNAKK